MPLTRCIFKAITSPSGLLQTPVNHPPMRTTDFLVIGSGLAGLAFALKASEHGRVLIISKESLNISNTTMAQGGIAAVMGEDDSFDQHIKDTLEAGAGLCRLDVVKMVVEQGPDRIRELVNWGVNFDLSEKDQFALTREGGHSTRRILHIADHTGRDIHLKLLALALKNEKIEFVENHFAVDLITNRNLSKEDFGPLKCFGAHILNRQTGEVNSILSRTTVLATGGAGKVYLYTSNWSGATGDGIAIAYRAGARVANLEFMQFHPTCLYHPNARNFLISEALRGEGGELINRSGQAFMKRYHRLGSLAPRDIVARSIDAEMKKSGEDCVFLDMRSRPKDFLMTRFPVIYKNCLELGIDMATQPIPVVPAAHYLCGGVLTDSHGRTDVQGLFALGETAFTGLHGANRLASNSLLECLVFSHNAHVYISKNLDEFPLAMVEPIPWRQNEKSDRDELIVISHMWEEIRRLMWNYVGIVRSNRRLQRAKHRLENIRHEIHEYYSNFKTHSDIEELRNIALVANLTVRCALERHESRGIHFSLDFPEGKEQPAHDTILDPIRTQEY